MAINLIALQSQDILRLAADVAQVSKALVNSVNYRATQKNLLKIFLALLDFLQSMGRNSTCALSQPFPHLLM